MINFRKRSCFDLGLSALCASSCWPDCSQLVDSSRERSHAPTEIQGLKLQLPPPKAADFPFLLGASTFTNANDGKTVFIRGFLYPDNSDLEMIHYTVVVFQDRRISLSLSISMSFLLDAGSA